MANLKDKEIIGKVLPSWTEDRILKLTKQRRYKAVPVDPLVFADMVKSGIPKTMEVKSEGVPESAVCVNWTFVPISNTMLFYFIDESFESVIEGVEVPLIDPVFTKVHD